MLFIYIYIRGGSFVNLTLCHNEQPDTGGSSKYAQTRKNASLRLCNNHQYELPYHDRLYNIQNNLSWEPDVWSGVHNINFRLTKHAELFIPTPSKSNHKQHFPNLQVNLNFFKMKIFSSENHNKRIQLLLSNTLLLERKAQKAF